MTNGLMMNLFGELTNNGVYNSNSSFSSEEESLASCVKKLKQLKIRRKALTNYIDDLEKTEFQNRKSKLIKSQSKGKNNNNKRNGTKTCNKSGRNKSDNDLCDANNTYESSSESIEKFKERFICEKLIYKTSYCVVYEGRCKRSNLSVIIKKCRIFPETRTEIKMTKLAYESCPEYCLPVLHSKKYRDYSIINPDNLDKIHKNFTKMKNSNSETDLRTSKIGDPFENTLKLREYIILVIPKFGLSLFEYICGLKRCLSFKETRIIYRQVAEALKTLQDRNFYHLDVKEENILVDPVTLKIKLIDFGVSRRSPIPEFETNIGSKEFCSPEVYCNLSNDNSIAKHDVWSLGVTIYSSLSGRLAYHHVKELIGERYVKNRSKSNAILVCGGNPVEQNVNNNNSASSNCQNNSCSSCCCATKKRKIEFVKGVLKLDYKFCSANGNEKNDQIEDICNIKDLLKNMLYLDYEKRTSFQAVLKHPFFRRRIPFEVTKEEIGNKVL